MVFPRLKHLFLLVLLRVKSVGILPLVISCQYIHVALCSSVTIGYRLPPSTDGEWWELSDDSRGGLSYYYQTRTGETVWERPSGFVIPLGIIQVCEIPTSHLGGMALKKRVEYSSRSSTIANCIRSIFQNYT